MNSFLLSNYSALLPSDAPVVPVAGGGRVPTSRMASAPAFEREVRPAADRILVVEDDADVCETIGHLLRHAGFRVDSASDGEAGWNALLNYRFNLLIADNRMPRLTGGELIARLRAAGSLLPAILASGTLPWEEPEAPQELRPISTLEKPFTGFALLAKVRAALRCLAPSSTLVPETIPNG